MRFKFSRLLPGIGPKDPRKTVLVGLLVGLVTVMHYITGRHEIYYHILYRELYFLPLLLAGFWFGLRGALITSTAVSFLYLPFIILHWSGSSAEGFSNLLEVVIFNLTAAVLGAVSDREKAEQLRLREAEGLAVIGRATSIISHDMKAPLIAIIGFAGRIQRKLAADDPCRDMLQIILRESLRLETMVKDMQEFVKPLNLKRAHGDINLLIQDSLQVMEEAAQAAGVKMEVELSPRLPRLTVDPFRLEQALINLMANAVQASVSGGRVTVRSYPEGTQVALSVTDCGCGIPSEIKEQIFYPFFTTKKHGTGLGLAIVRKIVLAHNGTIEVIDNPCGGVTFKILLPVEKTAWRLPVQGEIPDLMKV